MHETWNRFRESFLPRITEMTLEDLAVELSRKRAWRRCNQARKA
jgi:hypothetical protein